MSEPLRLLSLGAGVQSSRVLYGAIVGEFPQLDGCIFADTGDEPSDVYEHLEYLKQISPIPIYEVRRGYSISEHVLERLESGERLDKPPFWTIGEDGKPSIIVRDCTRQWNVREIERKTKELAGFRKGAPLPRDLRVETWLGISWDERTRMKVSDKPWQRFWHPLIEQPWNGVRADVRDQPITRQMCLDWIDAHGFRKPPKSACWHCPFRFGRKSDQNAGWRHLRDNCPDDWRKAVEFDAALRECGRLLHGMKNPVYLHPSLQPLSEVDLGSDRDDWLPLFEDECSGVCGV